MDIYHLNCRGIYWQIMYCRCFWQIKYYGIWQQRADGLLKIYYNVFYSFFFYGSRLPQPFFEKLNARGPLVLFCTVRNCNQSFVISCCIALKMKGVLSNLVHTVRLEINLGGLGLEYFHTSFVSSGLNYWSITASIWKKMEQQQQRLKQIIYLFLLVWQYFRIRNR